MSKSAVLTAVLLAAGGLAAAAGPAKAGVTREQLDKAIATLGDNAGIWAQGKNIPTKDLADLGSLEFDKQSAPVIMAALSGIKRDTEGLYVTARLLERLAGCDLETIRAVMPEVQRIILAAKGFYRPFPPYKATDDAAGLPKFDPRMTTGDIMARMGSADVQREAKKQRDLVVAKQNEAAWDTEQAAYKLFAASGDQNDDAKAMAAMNLAEMAGDGAFTIIIDAYQAAAPKMEPARAAKLYQILRPTALRLRMQSNKKYAIKGKSIIRADAASTASVIDESPGPRVLALLNKLVEVAKDKSLAPVRVPTQKEIDDFNKKR
jgi:hypothetical protein